MFASNVIISTLLSLALTSYASPIADPFAYAEANGLPAPVAAASYECHAACGNAILASQDCESDSGYDTSCLCSSSGEFYSYVPECLECGICLWDDYGSYLTAPLAACSLSTSPTATPTCPTEAPTGTRPAGTK